MTGGGQIRLPEVSGTSLRGRLHPGGIEMVWVGSYSQTIRWGGPLGTDTGRISTTSDGHLSLQSDFGIDIGDGDTGRENRPIYIKNPVSFDIIRDEATIGFGNEVPGLLQFGFKNVS